MCTEQILVVEICLPKSIVYLIKRVNTHFFCFSPPQSPENIRRPIIEIPYSRDLPSAPDPAVVLTSIPNDHPGVVTYREEVAALDSALNRYCSGSPYMYTLCFCLAISRGLLCGWLDWGWDASDRCFARNRHYKARGRVDMGVGMGASTTTPNTKNYRCQVPPLLPIAGSLGFYLEEASSSTVYAITCAHNLRKEAQRQTSRCLLGQANSSIEEGAVIEQPSPIDRAKALTTAEEHLTEQLAEKTEKEETRPGSKAIETHQKNIDGLLSVPKRSDRPPGDL
ncbi:hypothetical protein K440DRAFT_677263 [Wilcoxina mikolae CBS 423.85]|nr:hypothetical protein K440DRAFT_677263 [Wilcoxina mikolae CBS 423.85]